MPITFVVAFQLTYFCFKYFIPC